MTKHFRTTAPMPIESVNGMPADSYREFKKAADELQSDAAQPSPEMARIVARLKRPITAAELDTPDDPQRPTGLRKRLGLGPEPRGLRGRILGVDDPAPKTFGEKLRQHRQRNP